MKTRNLGERIQELENLALALNIEIKNETIKGVHPRKGGLCKIKGKYTLFIDKKSTFSEKFFILLDGICLFDFNNIYITPQLRGFLENRRRELIVKGKKLIVSTKNNI